MADNKTASGIPLDVVSIEAETMEQEAPKTAERKRRSAVSAPEVEEVTAVSVRHSAAAPHSHDDDELDDIIDAVLTALQERREGKTSSRRAARQAELAGPPEIMENPSEKTNKILMYTGIGVGSVALIGGLWWYFKKK
jgi:hypothetical protein